AKDDGKSRGAAQADGEVSVDGLRVLAIARGGAKAGVLSTASGRASSTEVRSSLLWPLRRQPAQSVAQYGGPLHARVGRRSEPAGNAAGDPARGAASCGQGAFVTPSIVGTAGARREADRRLRNAVRHGATRYSSLGDD